MTSFLNKKPAPECLLEEDPAEVFTEPLPSIATRFPPARSTASNRGEIFNPKTGRILVYESSLERRAALLFIASPKVADIWDQPSPVSFIDENGRKRSHTFDFLVTLMTGVKVAVAVKPMERAIHRGFFSTMRLVASQIDASFANKIVVLTDEELDPASAHAAETILIARRTHDPEADDAVERIAKTLLGSISVEQFIDRLGLGPARGFGAIARGLGLGLLRRVSTGHLCVSTQIASLVSEAGL